MPPSASTRFLILLVFFFQGPTDEQFKHGVLEEGKGERILWFYGCAYVRLIALQVRTWYVRSRYCHYTVGGTISASRWIRNFRSSEQRSPTQPRSLGEKLTPSGRNNVNFVHNGSKPSQGGRHREGHARDPLTA